MAVSEKNNSQELPAKSAIAVAVSTALTGVGGAANAQDSESFGIEEITVTATKRAENLQDVAASIQAFTGADLKNQGITNMEDVIRFLPSVSHIGGTAGANKIIFRGVSDNPNAFIAASSAALYIDEQPLTQFAVNPEPRLIDIERVEALAGPQGTLYGDSSQSGTMRIITNKPDPTAFSANAEVMLRNGSESATSYDVNAMVNIPLIEDKFAIRLVGFGARDGGFIDNVLGFSPQQGTRSNANSVGNDVNNVDISGGRVSAKWFVNDNWSVTGALIAQKSGADGSNDYDPTVGDLKTVKFYGDTRDDEWWQAAVTIEGAFANDIELVSSTSFFDRKLDYVNDRTTYSAYFNYNFCPYYATYCWSGSTQDNQDAIGFNTQDQENDRFTQEFRLSKSGDNYRWVVGAFYEKRTENWTFRSITPDFLDSLSYATWTSYYEPSGVDPSWWLSSDDTEWTQWAVFGNYTYDFNDRLTGEVGLRYFDQEMDRTYFVDKPFIVAPGVWPDVTNPTGGNDDIVPKVSLTYSLSDDKMVYGLYSEGFRAGGANRNRVSEELTVFPLIYEPDKLKNFEIGAKTQWLDGHLQVNATVFLGQWENYQIEAVDPSFNPCGTGQSPDTDPCGQPFQVVVANVGDAEQLGIEMEIKVAASERTDIGINLSHIEAQTSETFSVTDPENPVQEGTRLPNVPRLKYGAYAQYTWPAEFGNNGDLYVRGQYTYQGDSINQLESFEAVPLVSARGQFKQPAYGIADFRIGYRDDDWTVEAFISNLTDERAVIYNDDLFFEPFFGRSRVTTNRPREVGVRVAYSWD